MGHPPLEIRIPEYSETDRKKKKKKKKKTVGKKIYNIFPTLFYIIFKGTTHLAAKLATIRLSYI